ncbi:MAG: hypothetical protein ABIO60_00685 [Aquaticitalea sp.]
MNIKDYISELKRRNVIKSALAYLVVAWLMTQVMSIIIPAFELPRTLLRVTIIVLSIGFPCWLIFSWVYEITPDGIKKTKSVNPEHSITAKTSNRLNYVIIAALFVAIALLIRSSFYTPTRVVKENAVVANAPDKSIAVLAFADMSQEKDQEYFSDGISEEILNLLAKIPDLKVISRTSSFSFKGKETTTAEIGKALNVNHILEGSIRKSGNTFRITAQLIKVSDGAHVWSETYDREMTDIFKIQDEIASKVTLQLKATLLGTALTSTTVNIDAYNLYLQAKQVRGQNSMESNDNALKLIRASIAIDSSYAPAWALLARCFHDAGLRFLTIKMEDAIVQGKQAANKAIVLDPKYVEGYLELALLENASWDFKAASALIAKAVHLDPNNPRVIESQSRSAMNNGKKKLAIELSLKSIEIDPLTVANSYILGLYYLMDGQFTKAEARLNQYLLLYPNSGSCNGLMGHVQISLGHPEKALGYIEKETDPFWNLYRKCMAVHALGKTQEANELLKHFVADYGVDSWPNIAHVYAFRGERDEAFKWLDLAFENRDASLFEILNYPEMKNLWGDPRWNRFINKLGLPKDHGFHRD